MVSFMIDSTAMFAIIFLLYRSVNAQTSAEDIASNYRNQCRQKLLQMFFHDSSTENAKHALRWYYNQSDMDVVVEAYYNSMKTHLDASNIPSPEDYCDHFKKKTTCINEIKEYFGSNALKSLYRGFYEYNYHIIQALSSSFVRKYWDQIMSQHNFNDENFPKPHEFCESLYPVLPGIVDL